MEAQWETSMIFVNGNNAWVIGSEAASELVSCVGFVSMKMHVKTTEMSQISQPVREDKKKKKIKMLIPKVLQFGGIRE